jgi:pimeloyl-ACP methyl ester carboxylesterase
MRHESDDAPEMLIDGIEVDAWAGEYHPVRLLTSRGVVECRYTPAEGATGAVVWVGGAGGGWDSPAHDLYGRMSADLADERIASLRVRYRHANRLDECVLDVLAGVFFLQEQEGLDRTGLVGHSFGGAVVIQAGAAADNTQTVVTLATQSYGVEPAAMLPAAASLLLIHGGRDTVLPPLCSQIAHRIARVPKQLVLYEDAGHGLDEAADAVYDTVKAWLVSKLGA